MVLVLARRVAAAATVLVASLVAAQPEVPRQATALAVKGYQDASHVGPRDTSRPQPLVVVLHGNYDRPEWECDLWSELSAGEAWVLCTRGIRRAGTTPEEDRWTYASLAAAREELDAAERTLRARYPGLVGPGIYLVAGMSLGAAHARSLAQADPGRFSRAVLVEGGGAGWSDKVAQRFAAGGGRELVFACGQKVCADAAAAVSALARAGVTATLVHDPAAGHNYSERIDAALAERWRSMRAAAPDAGSR